MNQLDKKKTFTTFTLSATAVFLIIMKNLCGGGG